MKSINGEMVARVHRKIMRFGQRVANGRYFLAGLYAHRDHFALAVSDAYNFVRLNKHARPEVQCVSVETEDAFLRKVKSLDGRY